MPPSIFVSYSSIQGDWVWDRLIPVLKAGGADVLFDREQFEAARGLARQMDDLQDRATHHFLVLSPDYLASKPCQYEMKRSIARDPKFATGVTVPILRVDCKLPLAIKKPNPLHVNLIEDDKPDPWDLLLRKCELDLGIDVPGWLRARDSIRRYLDRGESVNLVVTGKARWRPLLDHLLGHPKLGLGHVSLDSTDTMHRPSLVQSILAQCGCPFPGTVPEMPQDLVLLGRSLKTLARPPRLALTSFDYAVYRLDNYGIDLFVALRDLIMNTHKLVLLIESKAPFATLVPRDHPMSEIYLTTVDLKGRS